MIVGQMALPRELTQSVKINDLGEKFGEIIPIETNEEFSKPPKPFGDEKGEEQ